MRTAIFAATVLAVTSLAAVPLPVLAQEQVEPEETEEAEPALEEPALEEMAERLSDPAEQVKLAAMLGTLSEVLLDMPVAPLLDAASRMPGADVPAVNPDATLRDIAGPETDQLPQQIAEKIPMLMGLMSGMAQNMEAMRPALTDMAEGLRQQAEAQDLR